MKKTLLILSVIFLSVGLCAAEKTLGKFEFNDAQKKNRYFKVFEKWAKEDEKRTPGGDAVLCIGSSSMRMWKDIKKDLAPLNIIHRGFGGSTMAHVLVWKNFFLRYKANTVVIYEGDNDLVNRGTPLGVFMKNYKTFCSELLKSNPKTKIYIISVKPSVSRAKSWDYMSKGNELLKKYAAETPQISFIDASTPMLDKDGKPRKDILLKDKLHMNKDGYKIWTKALRKALIKK